MTNTLMAKLLSDRLRIEIGADVIVIIKGKDKIKMTWPEGEALWKALSDLDEVVQKVSRK